MSPRSSGADGSAPPAGFGSVLHFASEEGSRRNSLAPAQAAAAMALAAEAVTRVAAATPPSAPASSSSDGSAEAAQPAAVILQRPEAEERPSSEAELSPAEWDGEPATTFQTLSSPLFGSADGERPASPDCSNFNRPAALIPHRLACPILGFLAKCVCLAAGPAADAADAPPTHLSPTTQQRAPTGQPGGSCTSSGPDAHTHQQGQLPEHRVQRDWHTQQWNWHPEQQQQQHGPDGGWLEEPTFAEEPPAQGHAPQEHGALGRLPAWEQEGFHREAAASQGQQSQATAWQATEAASGLLQAVWQPAAEPGELLADGPCSGSAAAVQGQHEGQLQTRAVLSSPPVSPGLQSPGNAALSSVDEPSAAPAPASLPHLDVPGPALAWQPASRSPWQADSVPDPGQAPMQAEQGWHDHVPASNGAAETAASVSTDADQRATGAPDIATSWHTLGHIQQERQQELLLQAADPPDCAAQADEPQQQMRPASPSLDSLDLDSPAMLAAAAVGGFSEYVAGAAGDSGTQAAAETVHRVRQPGA